jgi:hypothetical protein
MFIDTLLITTASLPERNVAFSYQVFPSYGPQEGEISFCAYNTGVGWRQIIENMHKTANLAEWYEQNERHAVYAAGHNVPGISKKHSLSLPIVNAIITEEDGSVNLVTPYLIEEREEEAVSV